MQSKSTLTSDRSMCKSLRKEEGERGQALARGGGGRDQAHTGETDQCPPVIGGRDTDNIMLYSFVNTSHV